MIYSQNIRRQIRARTFREEALNNYYKNPAICKHCNNIIQPTDKEKISAIKRKAFCDIVCKNNFNVKNKENREKEKDMKKEEKKLKEKDRIINPNVHIPIMNTKRKGNIAESAISNEFIRNNIPVLLPFGDNEKYDLVIEINGKFKSVQIKYATVINGCIKADARHRIGAKRIKYESYNGKVDIIAVWCEELGKAFLLTLSDFTKNTINLRIVEPKNNSCVTTVRWAKDYEFIAMLQKIKNIK